VIHNVVVFTANSLPIHTARSVQSWFEEHEDAIQHVPWSAQLSDLNIEPPLSVLEGRVRNSVPPSSPLKQLDFFTKSGTVLD
jgi:hypothetical protein